MIATLLYRIIIRLVLNCRKLFALLFFFSVSLFAQVDSVVSTIPLRNTRNVQTNTSISVSFSADVDSSTLTNSTIKINGSLSGLHTATYSYVSGTKTATLTPIKPFTFGEVVTITLTRGIKSVAGDSLLKNYTWSFTIKSNGGSGTFVQSSTPFVGSSPRSVTTGDFNGDGYLDLAAANLNSNTVSILLNNGNGSFTQSSTPTVGSGPYSVTTGDFNGDGYLDLAAANYYSYTVSILLNNGSGSFTQSSTPSVGIYPMSVTAGDFNGDGYLDLVAANSSSNTVSILLNNGSGSFTQNSTPSVGSSPRSVTTGDFNGDGYLDLAVANFNSSTVSILLNNRSGSFTQSSTPSVGSGPYSVTTGDFNGDGYLDLAAANYYSYTVSILLNNGSGSFTQSSAPSIGSYPMSVTAGDFNGDGYLDLVAANSSSNTVSILLNNGSGSFTQNSTPFVGSSPQSVTNGDFNGDGYLDLAAANYSSNTVSVLFNRSRLATISLPVSSISFGAVGSGSTKSVYFKITNNGTDSSLVVSNIVSSNSIFTVNKTSFTILPNATDSVQVTFAPPSSAAFNDSLKIYSNDPSTPGATVFLSGYSGNYISGVIISNTTWIKTNSPYIINGVTAVAPGVTLAIQSGVQVVFNGRYIFNVDGTLQVNGAVGDTVVFTSIAPDTMKFLGLTIRSGGSATFSFAKIQYADNGISANAVSNLSLDHIRFFGNTAGLSLSSATASLTQSVFTNNITGISGSSSSTLTMSNVTLSSNSTGVSYSGSTLIADTLTLTSNTTGMDVNNTTFTLRSSTLTGNGTALTNPSAGSWDVDRCTISNNTTGISCTYGSVQFTNNIITYNTGGGIYLYGLYGWVNGNTIRNNGRGIYTQSGITISNNDISNNTGDGITISSSGGSVSGNTIKNNGRGIYTQSFTTISNNDISSNKGNGVEATTNVTLQRNSINNNIQDGINIGGDATISNCDILNSGRDGVRTSAKPTISYCRVYGSGVYNLRATLQAGDSIIAKNNYWGTAVDANVAAKIYDYYDDGLTVRVAYKPFNTKPIFSPLNLAASSSVGQMRLSWSRNAESNFLRYRIYGGTASGSTTKLDSTVSGINDTIKVLTGLSPGTTYYFRVTAIDSTGIESDYSNEATVVQLPLIPVVALIPASNALSISPSTAIKVTFSIDMNSATFTSSTIKINGFMSGKHACTFTYQGASKTVTIIPTKPFMIGEVVTTTLTRGIKSSAGDSLIKNYSWSFTIKSNGGSGKFVQSSTPSVGGGPYSVAAGDFNGDGYLDFATANNYSWTVSILFNNGSGSFIQSSAPSVGSPPRSVTTGDFNGDGYLDLALANNNSNTVSILLNNGSGNFTQSSAPSVGTYPQSVTTGDFNGDSYLDLAVANGNSNTVSILFNNGSGSFTQSSAPPVGTYPQSVTSGDFNGDGYLDLVVANGSSNSVSILLNNGSGSFTQGSASSVGSSPQSVTTGDFNGDGYLDLATANSMSNTVSILLNNGSGSFTQGSAPSVGSSPLSVTTGDFNGDGYLDLAAANNNSSSVSILLNNGSGSFTQSSTSTVGSYPSSVTTGDFNGDGYLDLAAANSNSGTVSILRNGGKPAPPKNLIVSDSSAQKFSLKWLKSDTFYFLRYRIYRSTNSGQEVLVDSTTSGNVNDTSRTYGNLLNVVRYYFKVTAVDSAGEESFLSNEVSAVPGDYIAPNTPQGITAYGKIGAVSLQWNKNQENDVKRYKIYFGTIANSLTLLDSTSSANDTVYNKSGLKKDTTYYVRITAVDTTGNESGYSTLVSATPRAVGLSKIVIDTSSLQTNKIHVVWAKADSAVSYKLLRREINTGYTIQITTADTSYNDTGIITGAQYWYCVIAVNKTGEGGDSSNIATAATIPMKTKNLFVVNRSDRTITLTWQSGGGVQKRYKVYKSINGVTFSGIAWDTTVYTDTGLTAGTSYWYRVTALNAMGGESPYDSSIRITTKPARPQFVSGRTNAISQTIHDSVRIPYTIAVTTGDTIRLAVSLSTDGGSLFTPTSVGFSGVINGITSSRSDTILWRTAVQYNNQENTTLVVKIVAIGSSGFGDSAMYSYALVDNKPPQFAGAASTGADTNRITVNWNNATDVSIPITYKIFKRMEADVFNFNSPDTVLIDSSITFRNLENFKKYYFIVRAIDGIGNTDTNIVEVSAIPSIKANIASITTPIGTQSGSVKIPYSIQVGLQDTVNLFVLYSADNGTNFDTLHFLTDSNFNITKPKADTIRWQSTKEYKGETSGVLIKIIPNGKGGIGISKQTSSFSLDNKSPLFKGLSGIISNPTRFGSQMLNWGSASDLTKPITYQIYKSTNSGAINYTVPIDSTTDTVWAAKYLQQNKFYYFGVRAKDNVGNQDTNTVMISSKLPILTDYNGDNKVGAADLLIFKNAWQTNDTLVGDIGPAIGTPPNWQSSRDHKVNFEDVMVLALGWKWFAENPTALFLAKKNNANDSNVAVFNLDKQLIIKQNEKKPFALKIKSDKNIAGIDFAIAYDTSKIIIDSITFTNEKDLFVFKNINNTIGHSTASLVGMSDSLYKYLSHPEYIKVWITARQKLNEDKISLIANVYDYQTNLIRKAEQEMILSWRSVVPTEFALSQNYPNPFNPTTTIEYQLPIETKVTLKIYNILGQEVETIINDNQQAGYYSLKWNPSRFATGVYIYRLVTKDFVQAKKMILMK